MPLPYPAPTSSAVTAVMQANRKTDSAPEVRLRSALHAAGYRFRKNHPIRLASRVVRPDIVFTGRRLAVFVDGCFWHSCPVHGNTPRRNTSYWGPKLAGNVERDRLVDAALRAEGWAPLRIWEHEPTDTALARVSAALEAATARLGRRRAIGSRPGADSAATAAGRRAR